MPPLRLLRSFVALWWVVGVALLVLSARTVLRAAEPGHLNPHALLIGGVEALAALLFLIPGTLRVGGAGLLLTIAIAWAMHAQAQPVRWDLAVNAAAVLFVTVHGPLTGEQWRRVLSRSADEAHESGAAHHRIVRGHLR